MVSLARERSRAGTSMGRPIRRCNFLCLPNAAGCAHFHLFSAGVLKAHFGMFCLFTFIGSLVWCYFLTWVGIQFGNNMDMFVGIWHKFDAAIVLAVLALLPCTLFITSSLIKHSH